MTYSSEIRPGTIVKVNGEVYAPLDDGPRDVVLWNHESTGLADACAPSLNSPVGRIPAIEELLDRGYAVVASDYPGLGQPGAQYYMVGSVNARASLDAMKAAGMLEGLMLSGRYVQYGWSQGGQTALQIESMAADYAPDYEGVGTALIAPVGRMGEYIDRILETGAGAGYVMAIVPGLKELHPQLRVEEVLTPEGIEHLPDVERGCLEVWEALDALDSPYRATALVEGGKWREAVDDVDDFESAGSMPFVVYQGMNDWTTPADLTMAEAEAICRAGSPVEYRSYEGLDHSTVVEAAAEHFPTWVEERLEGGGPVDDCPGAD